MVAVHPIVVAAHAVVTVAVALMEVAVRAAHPAAVVHAVVAAADNLPCSGIFNKNNSDGRHMGRRQ